MTREEAKQWLRWHVLYRWPSDDEIDNYIKEHADVTPIESCLLDEIRKGSLTGTVRYTGEVGKALGNLGIAIGKGTYKWGSNVASELNQWNINNGGIRGSFNKIMDGLEKMNEEAGKVAKLYLDSLENRSVHVDEDLQSFDDLDESLKILNLKKRRTH